MSFAQPADQPPPPPSSAPKPPATGDAPQRGRGGQQQQPTTKQGMSMMNRALRTLKSSINDTAKKDDNLRAINDLQRGCVAAKGATPDRVLGKMDEAKRADASVQYRRALIQIMEKALKAETAIMDGKNADAAKLLTEIEKIRDDSHKAMGVRDEDEGDGGGRDGAPRGPGGPPPSR
jgi:hypothetical protein